ncbi:Cu2+-exporting ATPase [Croceicoccus naphthovorans]|uniref:Nitrogen fixation protein FixI n=1 Tax=Croceicoccus naphthovorans TaxID=1348774 RepID=A0A0G3XLH1_9SPHN|nr:heavy metal translocating P-type ATPase [Croceicoccus naphthovorans]AKM11486.1 nitrogen fixation protein FixI [Croceicoccus naphthovorans]MBB3991620.1 Cu2+-exporting ATPase [Croceicoccus naphthovorans]
MTAPSVLPRLSADEILLASRQLDAELRHTDLSVPGISCGGCIRKIEDALAGLPGVARARVNLSTRRVAVEWREQEGPPPLGETLTGLGYDAFLHEAQADAKDPQLARLIRAMAVAGFAAMNIMGLSISVWSGAAGETRDLFHWVSAAIALPTLAYSGRIFFQSAWQALRRGRTNMDVPISLGVLLAFAMSLYDTVHRLPHAYFDAAVSLLFFLLIGRTLDHVMREKARTAVTGLGRLAAYGATVIAPDGSQAYRAVEELEPGMTILLRPGDRIPVDAVVIEGRSDIDAALVTGESRPEPVGAGNPLRSGTLNLTGPLTILATASSRDSFLAVMAGLMEAAEGGRSHFRRIADRAASLYAPLVHTTAFLSFFGWMLATGDWHQSLTTAVAVLIITCPCALGLAVPMVQVVAARALFERGIMVKDGSAMERLVEVDTVVFDKTGTLTVGQPRLRREAAANSDYLTHLTIAAQIARNSSHPYAQALAAAAQPMNIIFDSMAEHAGLGLEAEVGGDTWRLGRGDWAIGEDATTRLGTVLACNGVFAQAFSFEDELRPGTMDAINALRARGFTLEIMSGDRVDAVASIATDLGIAKYQAERTPVQKTDYLASLAATGRKALMVGDGLNDAPALVAAHVSMAPGTAADIGRQAADFVFLHSDLGSISYAIEVARVSDRLIRQNFTFAGLYNLVALPLAIGGYVTPLMAALAMSGSSIVVVVNALRLSPIVTRRSRSTGAR